MKKYFSVLFSFILIFTFALSPLNLVPKVKAAWTTSQVVTETDVPAWIYIPSIHLLSYIEGMGIDQKGNMDVPPGNTNNVGWWKYGVLPGETGTAVFDAHNTAAFRNLHQVAPGSDIFIITTEGKLLKFTATKAETHSMAVLSPRQLFEETDSKQINLITCAGTLLGNGEATHRLIVSAQLAQDSIISSAVSS